MFRTAICCTSRSNASTQVDLCTTINHTDGNSAPYDPLIHFDEADFNSLVRATDKRAQTVIHGYAYALYPRHANLEATAQAKQDGPSLKSNKAIDAPSGFPDRAGYPV